MPIQAVHYVLADAGSNVVPVAPYVTFGTNELAKVVAESIGEADACLMQNHGMVACGKMQPLHWLENANGFLKFNGVLCVLESQISWIKKRWMLLWVNLTTTDKLEA